MKKYYRILFIIFIIFISFYIFPKDNKKRWVTAEPGLRMRKSPSIKSNRICTIPFEEEVILLEEIGKKITISERTGRWSKVKWKDKTGWVFGGFLTKNDPYKNKKITSIMGKYMLMKDPYKEQYIEFFKDGKCRAKKNFCEGFAVISGGYMIENNSVLIVLKDGNTDLELVLNIISKKELEFVSGAGMFTCFNFSDEDGARLKLK